jgi:hypothetical protein
MHFQSSLQCQVASSIWLFSPGIQRFINRSALTANAFYIIRVWINHALVLDSDILRWILFINDVEIKLGGFFGSQQLAVGQTIKTRLATGSISSQIQEINHE